MTYSQQFGFGFEQQFEEERTAHLPTTFDEAVQYYRELIDKHHAAMLVGDEVTVLKLRKEARALAHKLDPDNNGILSSPSAPGHRLENATTAEDGAIPRWGQTGVYVVDVDGMKIRIEQDGMLGSGTIAMFWPSFSAHAVDYDKPFISETDCHFFMGPRVDVMTGITPDQFAKEVIRDFIAGECKGKPRRIEKGYVERQKEQQTQGRERAP